VNRHFRAVAHEGVLGRCPNIPVAHAYFCGFGLGLIFSTLNVFLRDIGQVLIIALQLWMWLTPIVYVEEILPSQFRAALRYNPAYPFIAALHRMIVGGQWPDAGHWPAMAFWACATPAAGYLILRRFRTEIRDVL